MRDAAEQRDAVELSNRADSGNLGLQLVDLGLDRALVTHSKGAVGVLHGQLADALEHRVDLVQRTFSGLHHRDAVLRVALGLSETVDLAGQLLADREAGGVVSCAVDAQARGQTLH